MTNRGDDAIERAIDAATPKSLKPIPDFKNEQEEADFWLTHDSTEYVDWSRGQLVEFPNLKPSLPPQVLGEVEQILVLATDAWGLQSQRRWDEAKQALTTLIQRYGREQRVEELTQLCRDHWQKPIPEKAVLDRIAELNNNTKNGETYADGES